MRRTRILLTALLLAALVFPAAGPAAAEEGSSQSAAADEVSASSDHVDPTPTFDLERTRLDALVAAGGITAGLEAKIRRALDKAEEWMLLPNKRGPAMSHLDRAISLLLWQADVVDRGKVNQGDAAGLRALAATITTLANDYRLPTGVGKNLDYIRNLSGMNGITSINVLNFDDRDVLVAVGRFGVRTFDLTNPLEPAALDHLTSDELKLPGDVSGTFWQSESTNVDQTRKLIFLSRDPRAYNKPQSSNTAGVYFIDASDPTNLAMRSFHPIPAGHTSTCINDCQFLWTGGPAPMDGMPAEWGGRPIYVTDIRNLDAPYTYPDPIDIGRNQGITDYAHDVQVDNNQIAWVSGRGAVRGYHTVGMHFDPVLRVNRMASAWDPIPYAGGGGPEIWSIGGPAVMHNSERPSGTAPAGDPLQRDPERPERPFLDDGADYAKYGYEAGELLYATHENFNGGCAERGRFYISSLEGSYDGESWRATPENPFRMEVVSSWHPHDQEGYNEDTNNCSGHYFRMKDGLVYMSWYGQGTRVLDIRDPRNPTQVAYFRPGGTSSYTPMLYKDLVFVADSGRGIDILKLNDRAQTAAATGEAAVAPLMDAEELAMSISDQFAPDPVMGWLCKIPL